MADGAVQHSADRAARRPAALHRIAPEIREDCFESEWWQTVITGNDQLRQRVAFALSQLFVVSGTDGPGWDDAVLCEHARRATRSRIGTRS